MAAPTGFNSELDRWASVDSAGYEEFIAWVFAYGQDNGLDEQTIRVMLEFTHTRMGFEETVAAWIRRK